MTEYIASPDHIQAYLKMVNPVSEFYNLHWPMRQDQRVCNVRSKTDEIGYRAMCWVGHNGGKQKF